MRKVEENGKAEEGEGVCGRVSGSFESESEIEMFGFRSNSDSP